MGQSTWNTSGSAPPSSRGPATYTLTLEGDIADSLRALAHESGGSVEEVVAKGIALFRMAMDATAKGQAFGVADSADKLDMEIVGIGHGPR